MTNTILTQERLKEILNYDPDTGIFTWIKPVRKNHIGKVAGCIGSSGRINMKVCRERHLAHRLAWLYMTGKMPKGYIDHIDNNGTNNKFNNLRLCTLSENQKNRVKNKNNKTGYRGVYARNGKFRANIRINNKTIHLGTFNLLIDAHYAVEKYAKDTHGDFYSPHV